MKIGLFGGSFDPVHQGHLSVASKAVSACGLDELVFLPCARSPLKGYAPLASDERRLDMLKLAISDVPWTRVDRLDMDLPPPSWSWRVAELFHDRYPAADLFWLMGADQWSELTKWGRWEYLAEMVTFIVHFRHGIIPPPMDGVRAVFLEGDHPASSTEIRNQLAAGERIDGSWLDERVSHYIRKHGIYS